MEQTMVKVYEASGRDRLQLGAWKIMFRELAEYRELIHRLLQRAIAGQFRQSFLGYIWIALPPLATATIFSLLREARIVNVPMPEGAMPYPLFALVGTTWWTFFTQVTMMSTTSVANAGPLVSKIYFPREVIVLSSVGNAVINFGIRLVVVALTFALMGYTPHWQCILALPVLIPLVALGLGLGLFMAPAHAMTSDTGRVLEFLFQFGLFLAPTVYPTPSLSSAGSVWEIALFWLHQLNPVSQFLYATADLIQYGHVTNGPGLVVASGIGFLALAMGWRLFHACEPLIAERI